VPFYKLGDQYYRFRKKYPALFFVLTLIDAFEAAAGQMVWLLMWLHQLFIKKTTMTQTFEGHIKGDIPVVVDFFAEWCGPCKLMGPVLHEVKDRVGERATILKLDIDKSPYYSELYAVQAVPTVMIFKHGKVLWRKSGVASAQEILQHLNAFLS
jgi:thioredoxin 1